MKKLILALALFSSVCSANVPSDLIVFKMCYEFQVAQNEGNTKKEYELYDYLTGALGTDSISNNKQCLNGMMKAFD